MKVFIQVDLDDLLSEGDPNSEKRKPDNTRRLLVNGILKCHCGARIIGAIVSHRIMNGEEFRGWQYEVIPYCLKCEKKPEAIGDPVVMVGS